MGQRREPVLLKLCDKTAPTQHVERNTFLQLCDTTDATQHVERNTLNVSPGNSNASIEDLRRCRTVHDFADIASDSRIGVDAPPVTVTVPGADTVTVLGADTVTVPGAADATVTVLGADTVTVPGAADATVTVPGAALSVVPKSSHARGDELLDAMIEKQKEANFKRIQTRKALAKTKALATLDDGALPLTDGHSAPVSPMSGQTVPFNGLVDAPSPAAKKDAPTPAAKKQKVCDTPLKVPKPQVQWENTRDQYLVRSGLKGPGSSKSFRVCNFGTKEAAEKAAYLHLRKVKARLLASAETSTAEF
jgi:hypothetical protein